MCIRDSSTSPDENAANVRLLAAYPSQASAVTPSVIPAAGGALLAVSLATPISADGTSITGADATGATGSTMPLQCRVAAIGPVASRTGGRSAGAATGVLECIAPAYVPARRPVALEVGPGRGGWHVWRSEGMARPDAKLLVLPVGAHATAWPAPPGVAVTSQGNGGPMPGTSFDRGGGGGVDSGGGGAVSYTHLTLPTILLV